MDHVESALDDVGLCNSSTHRRGMLIRHHRHCSLMAENDDDLVSLKEVSSIPLDEINSNGE